MEVKILDSIIHGFLKPWKLDTTDTRRFTELVKAAKAASPSTNAELLSQLIALLVDYPTVQKILNEETIINTPLQPLLCKTDLPKYKDAVTHFYYIIITGETLRVFNSVLQQAATWTELVDIRYQVGKTLTNIRVLAKQVSIELNEQGFIAVPDEQSSFVHFALYYLKHSLIQLYFSVQEQFKASLQQVTTLEDFYLLDLEEPVTNIVYLEFIEQPDQSSHEQNLSNTVQDKVSFGFTGDKERLKAAIVQLCQKIDLLIEDKTSSDDLFAVLTSRDLEANTKKIYLGCETTQFRYIIDKITLQFTNLKLKAIEKTKAFYSKNGTLITAQNLSAGKVDNPKEKGTIDNILKQMQ
ncbi:MAG: DUF6617 family protein [Ferruginibacter sp.]